MRAKNFTPIFRDMEREETKDFVKRERNKEYVLVKCVKVPEYSTTYFTKGKIYKMHFRLCGSFFTSCMGGYLETDRGALFKTFWEVKRENFEFLLEERR